MKDILDARTQFLIALGAAVAAKCQHCFATLYWSADKVGATDREIRAAVAIATKVAGKSQDFMAAFVQATTKGTIPATDNAGGCGCT